MKSGNLRLLYVSHSPAYPDALGGSELSMHYLLRALAGKGWTVEAVCQASAARLRDEYRPPDFDNGYSCHRVPPNLVFDTITARVAALRPHAALANVFSMSLHLLLHCRDLNVPGFYYPTIPESLLNKYGPRFRIPDGIHCLANSEVTAANLREVKVGDVAIVRPMVDCDGYRCVGRRETKYVTFINPEPVKGVAVALKIAEQLPERRFLFVTGRWGGYTSGAPLGTAQGHLGGVHRLPNVEVWEAQQDMRKVYAQTAVLLMPSQWEEPFGRVALEAHLNGIPVVAAAVGGIPHQVGRGAILISPRDDVAGYVQALRTLADEGTYRAYAERALENSKRPELQPEQQVSCFVDYVRRCLGPRDDA